MLLTIQLSLSFIVPVRQDATTFTAPAETEAKGRVWCERMRKHNKGTSKNADSDTLTKTKQEKHEPNNEPVRISHFSLQPSVQAPFKHAVQRCNARFFSLL